MTAIRSLALLLRPQRKGQGIWQTMLSERNPGQCSPSSVSPYSSNHDALEQGGGCMAELKISIQLINGFNRIQEISSCHGIHPLRMAWGIPEKLHPVGRLSICGTFNAMKWYVPKIINGKEPWWRQPGDGQGERQINAPRPVFQARYYRCDAPPE